MFQMQITPTGIGKPNLHKYLKQNTIDFIVKNPQCAEAKWHPIAAQQWSQDNFLQNYRRAIF